jgi:carbon monoxide dehydrogenase subunit G
MELHNEFTVDVPVERAWEVLTDVPTIAPCLPGAQLKEVDGDEYRGIVKVKVGPITAQYRGSATFLERDPAARRAVIRGHGRETRGQGDATAVITAQLRPDGDERTTVEVTTDLSLTGKVASLGRGAMAEVSAKLMDQFADNLRTTVLAEERPGEAAPTPAPEAGLGGPAQEVPSNGARPQPSGARPAEPLSQPEPEAIDLLGTAGVPVLKRLVPVVVAVALLVALGLLLVRRRRRAG